jgi:hypothetical protein
MEKALLLKNKFLEATPVSPVKPVYVPVFIGLIKEYCGPNSPVNPVDPVSLKYSCAVKSNVLSYKFPVDPTFHAAFPIVPLGPVAP